MSRILLLGMALLSSATPLFAATTPLFSDSFTVTANSNSVNIEIPGTRQSGSLAPILYSEQDNGQDNYSQVNRPSFEGRLFMAASSSANLVKVSPNSNFITSPGTNGVFYIEFDVNPVINSVANTNPTATAWAAIKFGSTGQNKSVNDPDGFGILFRGEASRLFQAFNDGNNVTPASPNDSYTADTTDSFHTIRIELRRVTPGPGLFDGSPVQIKCFVDSNTTPILTFVRNSGFVSNFISLISETEGSGGDGISRHCFDNLRVTAAPAPAVSLSLPGGNTIQPNTAIPAVALETGVTSKVEFFLNAVKVGEDTTATDGFTFNYAGQATGGYALTAVTTDLFGQTATSAPVNIIVTQRPTATLTSPADNALFLSGTPVNATASASDTDGSVVKVEFFRNGSKVGEDTNGGDGFTFTYGGATSGNYTLGAVATDNLGATSTLSSISIRVSDAPTVVLTSPSNNTVLDEPADLVLVAVPTDTDGSVVKVEFLANGVKIAEDTSTLGGFTAVIPGFPPGVYALTAVATDDLGLSGVSAASSLRIRTRPRFDSTVQLTPNPALAGQTLNGFASAGAAAIGWNWGDGSTSSGGSVEHVYTVPGVYTAIVSATNSEGVVTAQSIPIFVGENLFGPQGLSSTGDGVTGVLIGGDGIGTEQGATAKVKCDYVRRARTSLSGTLSNLAFPTTLTQEQLTNLPGTLHIGSGASAIPYSFSLNTKGLGRATSVKKIELSLVKKRLAFTVQGQPALTDLLESLGARRQFGTADNSTIRLPATLQIGTRLFLAFTFEIDFTAQGRRGRGGLAE